VIFIYVCSVYYKKPIKDFFNTFDAAKSYHYLQKPADTFIAKTFDIFAINFVNGLFVEVLQKIFFFWETL